MAEKLGSDRKRGRGSQERARLIQLNLKRRAKAETCSSDTGLDFCQSPVLAFVLMYIYIRTNASTFTIKITQRKKS